MNTRFYGIGRVGIAWRSYRRLHEPRHFGTTVIRLPFNPDPGLCLKVWQLRVGPFVLSVRIQG